MPGFPDLIDLLPSVKGALTLTDERLSYWTGQSPNALARQRQRARLKTPSVAELLHQSRSDWGIGAPPVAVCAVPQTERLPAVAPTTRFAAAQADRLLSAYAQVPDASRLARIYLIPSSVISAWIAAGVGYERDRCYTGHRLDSLIDGWSETPAPNPPPLDAGSAYLKEGVAVRRALTRREDLVHALTDAERAMIGDGLLAWRAACRDGKGQWLFRRRRALLAFLATLRLLGVGAAGLNASVIGHAPRLEDLAAAGIDRVRFIETPSARVSPSHDGAVIIRVMSGRVPGLGSQSRMARALVAIAAIIG
jgi:hypothetical protein